MKQEMLTDLTENILPFWMTHAVDKENGGFYGEITKDNAAVPNAGKSLILNSRILWTFATAYRELKREEYNATATRAFDYITAHFIDAEGGGGYYMVNADGSVHTPMKMTYAQGFLLYGLSAYALIEPSAVPFAAKQFDYIVNNCKIDGKYLDKFGDREMLSMNTYLHIIEPVTLYYKVERSDRVRREIAELLETFLTRIYNAKARHFDQVFNAEWEPFVHTNSFGHDIEGTWLLCESADALGDAELSKRTERAALDMAYAVLEEGCDPVTGAITEEGDRDGNITRDLKVWWAQAEGIVGFYNAYKLSGDSKFLTAAERCWRYTKSHIIAPDGEWYGTGFDSGIDDNSGFKVNAWKCPYHNSRAAMEIAARA